MSRNLNTTVRRFLMVSSIALALPVAAMASPGEGCDRDGRAGHYEMHGDRDGKRGGPERMFEKLDLTEAQRVQARKLMDQHRDRMKAERTSFLNQMDTILTPEQKVKAKEMRARHEERMKERRDRREDES